MRHYKAGLAIPDFPLAFGMLVPPLNSFDIIIHFTHRIGAVFVSIASFYLAAVVFIHARNEQRLVLPVVAIMFLVVIQVMLGASIIWYAKAAVPTTFHVMNGAALIGCSVMLAARAFCFRQRDIATGERQYVNAGLKGLG